MYIPTFDDVKEAQKRISPHIHKTPVLTSSFMNELSGAELFFKCENFQKAGVFKVRGASNAVFGLSEEEAVKGVATHSSGNHALSLAYAAGRRGIPVTVVMPHTALEAKKAAVYGYGGSIVECEPSTSSREETFAKVVAESGADSVHPYNDPRVISGQATCSLELLEQVGKLMLWLRRLAEEEWFQELVWPYRMLLRKQKFMLPNRRMPMTLSALSKPDTSLLMTHR